MAINRAAFNIQLQGYTPANRDATVRLVHESTGQVIERQPFLDGSLLIRDMEPGFYELQVTHPNLINPIEKRRVRLFPQPAPTVVPVVIPPDLFRDSPIRDIPDANLGPVQTAASTVRTQLQPLAAKGPGEAIRASDWNALVGAVVDLSSAVLELTNLVSPKGHDHPEIAEKIDEVQGNIRRFAEAFGRSLVELRREIEVENLHRTVRDVLDTGGATQDMRDRVLGRLDDLRTVIQSDTPLFTQKLAVTGATLLNEVNDLAVAQGANADTFRATAPVQQLVGAATTYFNAGTQTRPESELMTYVQSSAAVGGTKLGKIIGG